jgi:hypothetical protein
LGTARGAKTIALDEGEMSQHVEEESRVRILRRGTRPSFTLPYSNEPALGVATITLNPQSSSGCEKLSIHDRRPSLKRYIVPRNPILLPSADVIATRFLLQIGLKLGPLFQGMIS